MAKNKKKTSPKVTSLAAKVLKDKNASEIKRRLAASALSQAQRKNETGSKMEEEAGKVLQSSKYSDETKTLAATVLAQSNKAR